MNNHPHEAQVQRYAASALKNLSSDNSENKQVYRHSISLFATVGSARKIVF
jgi:hypothetical protein